MTTKTDEIRPPEDGDVELEVITLPDHASPAAEVFVTSSDVSDGASSTRIIAIVVGSLVAVLVAIVVVGAAVVFFVGKRRRQTAARGRHALTTSDVVN